MHEPTASNLEDVARALGTTPRALRVGVADRASDGGTSAYVVRTRPRLPPRAYQVVFDHCTTLEDAGVPEDLIEEARRLMSDDTFNTLNKGQADPRTETDWIKDIEAAWVFIRDRLKAKGFRL